jgi:hypothetical protein
VLSVQGARDFLKAGPYAGFGASASRPEAPADEPAGGSRAEDRPGGASAGTAAVTLTITAAAAAAAWLLISRRRG